MRINKLKKDSDVKSVGEVHYATKFGDSGTIPLVKAPISKKDHTNSISIAMQNEYFPKRNIGRISVDNIVIPTTSNFSVANKVSVIHGQTKRELRQFSLYTTSTDIHTCFEVQSDAYAIATVNDKKEAIHLPFYLLIDKASHTSELRIGYNTPENAVVKCAHNPITDEILKKEILQSNGNWNTIVNNLVTNHDVAQEQKLLPQKPNIVENSDISKDSTCTSSSSNASLCESEIKKESSKKISEFITKQAILRRQRINSVNQNNTEQLVKPKNNKSRWQKLRKLFQVRKCSAMSGGSYSEEYESISTSETASDEKSLEPTNQPPSNKNKNSSVKEEAETPQYSHLYSSKSQYVKTTRDSLSDKTKSIAEKNLQTIKLGKKVRDAKNKGQEPDLNDYERKMWSNIVAKHSARSI